MFPLPAFCMMIPFKCQFERLEYTVKDSFTFAKEITKTDCNCVRATLDVESLFTNITLQETIGNCSNDFLYI